MKIDRRTILAAAPALLAVKAFGAAKQPNKTFPTGFLWGAATAGHQVEGNNVTSDTWFLENIKPTVFAEPSGDACNSFELWERDLDLVKQLGLNSYRFSIEWARIEPEQGLVSMAMLDHYKAMIEGCRKRGLTPLVTYSHFTAPRWFAAQGGWTNPQAPGLFARFAERATRHLGAEIGYVTTFNEPNLPLLLKMLLPPPVFEAQRAMLDAAARASGTPRFVASNAVNADDIPALTTNLIAGHKAAKAAIKGVRPDLPVGVSLAMIDDQAVGRDARKRDAVRSELYGQWLEAARGDDYLGVQNYERKRYDAKGAMPAPADARRNFVGTEVYPLSLAGAVRYAHAVTGNPIMVSEHGVGLGGENEDDALRSWFITESLAGLKGAIDDGVPVKGYMHWSLLDNFEWIFGYRPRFGLVAVDRKTFERKPKASAAVYGAIAQRNSL
jgi:beta-glucosidase